MFLPSLGRIHPNSPSLPNTSHILLSARSGWATVVSVAPEPGGGYGHGWMDGQTDGRKDGWTGGAGQVNEGTDQSLGPAQCKGEKAASLGATF